MQVMMSILLVLGMASFVNANEVQVSNNSKNVEFTAAVAGGWVCKARGRKTNRGYTYRRGKGPTRDIAAKNAMDACYKAPFVRACSLGPCFKK